MWTSGDLLAVGLITCKQEVECTEGVHLVVPSLGLFLTQEPYLHLVEELLLVGTRRLTDGAHGSQLGRDAIVAPRIVGLVGSVVATHAGLRDGVFDSGLQEVVGTLGVAEGTQNAGSHSASVDGEVAHVLLYVTQIGFAHGADLLAHLVVGSKRTGVEVAERIVACRDGDLLADAVLVVLEFLFVEEVQAFFEHLGFDIQSLGALRVDQHGKVLADGERHVVTSGHSFEPAPRAVALLQFLEACARLVDAFLHETVVEEVEHTGTLFGFAQCIVDPWGFLEHDVAQVVVAVELALLVSASLFGSIQGILKAWDALCNALSYDVGIERGGISSGAVTIGHLDTVEG